MRGMPKIFNTAKDVLNALEYDRKATVALVKQMYANRFCWQVTKDDPAKVVKSEDVRIVDGEDGVKVVLERVEDPNHTLRRIGMKDKDILKILEEAI